MHLWQRDWITLMSTFNDLRLEYHVCTTSKQSVHENNNNINLILLLCWLVVNLVFDISPLSLSILFNHLDTFMNLLINLHSKTQSSSLGLETPLGILLLQPVKDIPVVLAHPSDVQLSLLNSLFHLSGCRGELIFSCLLEFDDLKKKIIEKQTILEGWQVGTNLVNIKPCIPVLEDILQETGESKWAASIAEREFDTIANKYFKIKELIHCKSTYYSVMFLQLFLTKSKARSLP